MSAQLDDSLHWTDHYVEHGFAVIRGAIDRAYCQSALEEVARKLVCNGLPPSQWTVDNVPARHIPVDERMEVCKQVYDQPAMRQVIDAMHGPGQWDGQRKFQVFVGPYDADAEPKLAPRGHLDFVRSPIPVLGSGLMFQLSLVKSEPFGGNITIYPGTHKVIQRMIMDDPGWRYPDDADRVDWPEPFEFVADPGDLLLFHHLVGHEGNANHAAGRSPRVVIHGQINRSAWLESIDPAQGDLTPWERSLALNCPYTPPRSEQQMMMEHAARKKAAANT